MSRSFANARLRDLIEAHALRRLTAVEADPDRGVVRSIVVITEIDDIRAAGPDSMLLLTPALARGGWMISVALRYAWERHAGALVVPEQSFADAVIELAKRLNITLLTTEREIVPLALDLSRHLGETGAGTLTRVQAFAGQLAGAADATEVLRLVSRELRGAEVQLEMRDAPGVAMFRSPAVPAEAPRSENRDRLARVTARVSPPTTQPAEILAAYVPKHDQDDAQEVLQAAAPIVRALLAESRLDAFRTSLPTISIAALANSHAASELDEPTIELLVDRAHWAIHGPYAVVCIFAPNVEELGAVVHNHWFGEMADAPLISFSDGWLAFVEHAEGDGGEALRRALRTQFAPLAPLGVRLGVSSTCMGSEQSVDGMREAWLSARLAHAEAPLVTFEGIDAELLPRLVPREFATQILRSRFPSFMLDGSAASLAEAVTEFLEHQGSIASSSACLGIHRNTLQQRVRRAEQAGLELSDPAQVLPVHMLLRAAFGVGH